MVRIITDSAADLEPEELKRLGVACIPLFISFDDVPYQGGANLTKRQFYSLLESTRIFPHTVEDFDEQRATELMNDKNALEHQLAQYDNAQQGNHLYRMTALLCFDHYQFLYSFIRPAPLFQALPTFSPMA